MLFIKFAESSIPFIAPGQPPANAASRVNASAAIPAQLAVVVFSDVSSSISQQECIYIVQYDRNPPVRLVPAVQPEYVTFTANRDTKEPLCTLGL